ncbi:Predicted mitochondrial carrier protein [Phaffia rhodozyma]|uniref:Predicted mitochondrial carrier protein n=1 Tax=Phaffia rhodozyma TaxID=264483 RepID=A0A0F7SEZ0_PHARH|nr:Predicted mitochondrial carrier protein [Phaffia rhodozyma]
MSVSKQARELSPWGHALAGALGAVFANASIYPLDTIKTRIQAAGSEDEPRAIENAHSEKSTDGEVSSSIAVTSKKADDVITGLVRVLKEEGIAGYYKGFLANMLNTFSMQYAYFFFYSLVRSLYFKRLARKSGSIVPPTLSTAAELFLGAVAGAFAQVFTIPVAVIATRQQLSGSADKTGFLEVGREVIREDGITGLWRGLKPGLVLTINPAITYGAFERIKGTALRSTGKEKLSPGMAFLVGATSKSLATVVTYPYIMAKVRLQARTTSSEQVPVPSSTSVDYSSSLAPRPSEVASIERPTNESPAGPVSYAQVVKTSSTELVTGEEEQKNLAEKEKYGDAVNVLRQVYLKKGFTGWYQGMSAQILKAVLSQGILFMLKDQFESYTFLLLLLFSKAFKPTAAAAANISVPSTDQIRAKSVQAMKDVQEALPSAEKTISLAKRAAEVIGKDVVEKVVTDQVVGAISK